MNDIERTEIYDYFQSLEPSNIPVEATLLFRHLLEDYDGIEDLDKLKDFAVNLEVYAQKLKSIIANFAEKEIEENDKEIEPQKVLHFDELLSKEEIEDHFGVDATTIEKWEKNGLKSTIVEGIKRYEQKDILQFKMNNKK